MEKTSWVALDSKVIAVGVAGEANDWAAYIGAVPGICHRNEWQSVEKRGAKLPQKVAETIFPQMSHLKWRG